MRSRSNVHTHPCSHCKTPVECHGEWERNYDGWPEAICGLYHLPDGHVADIYCEACLEEYKRAFEEEAKA